MNDSEHARPRCPLVSAGQSQPPVIRHPSRPGRMIGASGTQVSDLGANLRAGQALVASAAPTAAASLSGVHARVPTQLFEEARLTGFVRYRADTGGMAGEKA